MGKENLQTDRNAAKPEDLRKGTEEPTGRRDWTDKNWGTIAAGILLGGLVLRRFQKSQEEKKEGGGSDKKQ
jgi:hypothetical protein